MSEGNDIIGDIDYEMRYFRAAAFLIKSLCIIIGGVLLFFSQFAFVFYCISMIPSVIASFIDKKYESYMSSTITTFNLIGVLPFMAKLWSAPSMDNAARIITSDISTWVVVFGAALLGQLLFWFLPPVIARLYILKCKFEASMLKSSKEKIASEWNIKIESSNSSKE